MTRSALVLTVDGLGAGYLRPYGGTWAPTPNFNRLAAQSLVLDNAIADSPDLVTIFRSFWQGVHACATNGPLTSANVIESASELPVRTILVTDDSQVAAHPLAEYFTQRMLLPTADTNDCADDVEESQFAQSLAATVDVLEDLREPFLFWVHLRGMIGPWDAPLALRESLRGDDDPLARTEATVPSLRLDADYDPDLLLGITQAYAAQVMLVDMGLGALLAAIDAHPARAALLLIATSPRGFPLGEHLQIGQAGAGLYGELLHVPLFVRRGDGVGALARDHALVQPADIAATLADWFELPSATPSPQAASLLALTVDTPRPWPRQQTLSIDGLERATRTSAWYLRHQPPACELFSKPDDRCEANEISSLCPLIVEQLSNAATALEQALIANDFAQLAPLPPELLEGIA